MLGIGMQRRGQGRSTQADRIGRTRKVQVGNRLDEAVPFHGRELLDLVQVGIGRSEPGEGRPQPVLERAPIAAPAR